MILGHEKIDFLYLPTPLERLDNVSADLGINLYMKRDDLTPLAAGGNKLRKLEYLLKDAKDKGATFLLTVGGAQTNHGRLTLAVARKYGMGGAIVAVDEYPGELSANLLLDGMMGCDVWLKKPDGVTSEDQLLAAAVEEATAHYEALGEKVYYIPMGGSNEIGSLGYYECAVEIAKQASALELDDCRMVTTVGSFGTYMGLFLGIENEKLPLKLTGISVLPMDGGTAGLRNYALDYFGKCCDFFGMDYLKQRITADNFDVTADYDRGAYNNPCKEVRDAMYYMAEKEAIILDPCYTGKAFAGLMEMVKKGDIKQGENVIFIHTGGMPGINTPFHRVEIEKERERFMRII